MESEEKKEQELNETQPQAETPAPDPNEKKEKKKKGNKESDIETKIQEMGEKLVEANDKYMRVAAEYENYRKRTAKEKEELLLNGGKDIIKSILPVIDDMERALQAISNDDPSKEGVQLIYNKLMGILAQKGLKPIDAKGEKFDETLHDAITQIPAPDESLKGMVVDVVEKGYFLNDKVLRFSKVVVGM